MKLKYFAFVLILGLTLQGCSKSQVNNVGGGDKNKTVGVEAVSKSNFVNQQFAINAARQFANSYRFNVNRLLHGEVAKKKSAEKEVGDVLSVSEAEKEEAMYFVNFSGGGFVIISADKRINPILAYSEDDQLPSKTSKEVPGGLSLWVKKNIRGIGDLRTKNKTRSSKSSDGNKQHSGWKTLLDSGKKENIKSKIPIPDDPCTPRISDVQYLIMEEHIRDV